MSLWIELNQIEVTWRKLGELKQVFRKVSTLGLHVRFCCFKGCCSVMRGQVGIDSKALHSYLENPRTLKIWVRKFWPWTPIFRPSTQDDASVQKSLSEVWAWWPLVANLVEAMVARFLTSVQSQFFSSDSEILQVSLTQTRLPFDCLLFWICWAFQGLGQVSTTFFSGCKFSCEVYRLLSMCSGGMVRFSKLMKLMTSALNY